MSEKIKAILIEVATREVRQIEIEKGLGPIYDALECQIFERVPLDRKNSLFVDEEGLFASPQADKFTIRGYPHIFTGNGLILAQDGNGGDADTTLSPEHVKTLVCWKGAVHVELQMPRIITYA